MKIGFSLITIVLAAAIVAASQETPAAKESGTAGSKPTSQKSASATGKQALIREALSAAPPDVAKSATVKDWDGNVLKQGNGAYTCFPTPPTMKNSGRSPMCVDQTWQAWADAWQHKKDFKADKLAIAYMLEGDTGASNTDPYATGPTADNHWVVSGPHTMILVPNASDLDSISDDPNNGGPFVMWKGTPYAHIMVPVGRSRGRGARMAMTH
jgi:hypothetical protein